MVEFLKRLSVSEILQYYAVLCLSLAPLNLFLVYILYKYTNLIEKFDHFLDKHLTKKVKQANSNEEPKEGQVSEDKTEKESPKDAPELSGISCFSLSVGQIYYCRQNSQERASGIFSLRWFTSNEFLGKVNEDAVFTALKAGVVDVFSSRKNDDFDHGAHAYRITVLPRNKEWSAQRAIELLLCRAKREKVLAAYMDSKILRDDETRHMMEFRQNGDFEKVILQFDKSQNLERAVFVLNDRRDPALLETIKDIKRELEDRFEEVKLTKGEGISLWIHRLIDEEHDEIDIYAYMRISASVKGKWILCIGQTWREYGEIDEFLLNANMAEKMFSSCLPEENYIGIEAFLPTTKTQEETPNEEPNTELEETKQTGSKEKPQDEAEQAKEDVATEEEKKSQETPKNEQDEPSEEMAEKKSDESESNEPLDPEAGTEVDILYNSFEDID